MKKEPPIAIIRTIPTLSLPGKNKDMFERTMAHLEAGTLEACYFALPTQPKHEVLHLYIVTGNLVVARFVVAGYCEGEAKKCWDGNTRAPGCWAICTAPISSPPRPITMRGFRGFRYLTEELW